MRRTRLVAALALFALVACATFATPLVVVRFPAAGQQQTSVALVAGRDVNFWTNFSARYGGWLEAKYLVEVLQEDVVVARTTCDVMNPTSGRICAVHIEVGDSHLIDCSMTCGLRVLKSGPSQVRATLLLGGAPVDLRLERADLSVEQ